MGLGSAAKRVLLEILGWALVLIGIVALVLPGPGLLLLAGGLAVLSQQYEWAAKRVDPIFDRARQGAIAGMRSWPHLLMSLFGVLWILSPDAPAWWPLAEQWWLPGGWGTGASLLLSGLVVAGMLIYARRLAVGQKGENSQGTQGI